MKVCVVGGGSTYTPELIEGFALRQDRLGLREVCLHDVDAERLGAVSGFCERMAAAMGGGFSVTRTLDLAEAAAGADFAVVQIRVGGQKARHDDTLLALKYGLVGQETTGVGGFAKAMRTIPAVYKILDTILRASPGCGIINFTNPSGIVTEAILRRGDCLCIGLCNIPVDMKMTIAAFLGVEEKDLRFDYVGLNHLSWVRKVFARGEDVTGKIVGFAAAAPSNVPDFDFPGRFLRSLGMIPSPYLRYFYMTDEVVAELQAKPLTRAQEVMRIEEELLGIYRDPAQSRKPDALSLRGGAWYSKVAVDVIDAVSNDTGEEHVVNCRNEGAVEGIDDDAVVEASCLVDRRGAHPRKIGRIEPHLLGLMQEVKAYERLTIEAALESKYDKALLALVANPLVRSASKAEKLLNELAGMHGWKLA